MPDVSRLLVRGLFETTCPNLAHKPLTRLPKSYGGQARIRAGPLSHPATLGGVGYG